METYTLLKDGGLLGALAIALMVIAYMFRALRSEQAARLADRDKSLTDQAAIFRDMVNLQKQVSESIDKISDLMSKGRK